MWCGGRLTKRQATSRSDLLLSEIWRSMSKNSQTREKQNWVSEKTKLDNAKKTEKKLLHWSWDTEFKEFIKNTGKKLEVPTVPAVSWKRTDSRHEATRSKSDDPKSKITCINGSRGIHETTYGRNCVENSRRSHCRKKGVIHCSTSIWYMQLKKQWTKNDRNLRNFPRGI